MVKKPCPPFILFLLLVTTSFFGSPPVQAQELTNELKLSLFIRVPKDTFNSSKGLEALDSLSPISIDSYLLAKAQTGELCILAKQTTNTPIIAGSLNLSFAKGIGQQSSSGCTLGYCSYTGAETEIFSGIPGATAQTKWLNALKNQTLSLTNVQAFSDTNMSSFTSAPIFCAINTPERYLGIKVDTVNKAGQPVSLKFKVKLGAAPYATIASQVTPGSVNTEHIANFAVSVDKIAPLSVDESKLAPNSVTSSKIAPLSVDDEKIINVSSSKLTGTIGWNLLPSPLSGTGVCQDGEVLIKSGTAWICSTISSNLSNSDIINQSLTGLNTSLSGNISSSDTIISALGKIEHRLAANDAKIGYSSSLAQQDARLALSSSNSFLSYNSSTGTFTLNVGNGPNTVAAGNDPRIVGALQKSGDTMSGSLNMGENDVNQIGHLSMRSDRFFDLSTHNIAPNTSGWDDTQKGRVWFNAVTNTIDYWDGTSIRSLGRPVTSSQIADGTIVDADISASANIADTKLATITTAGKVSGNAITSGTIGGSTSINTTGNIIAQSLGIGVSPGAHIHIATEGEDARLRLENAIDGPIGPHLESFKSRGTLANKTPVMHGDVLLAFYAHGRHDSGVRNGGNAFILIRADSNFTSSNQATRFEIFGTPENSTTPQRQFTITSKSNVGIGDIANPKARLDIDGALRTKSATSTNHTIDFAQGNTVSTTADCSSNISFSNLLDGGSYTLVVTSTNTNQCNFSTALTGEDAATVNYRFRPANGPRTASSHTIYSLLRVGNTVYVSWDSGF
jgi:hypothetical protein